MIEPVDHFFQSSDYWRQEENSQTHDFGITSKTFALTKEQDIANRLTEAGQCCTRKQLRTFLITCSLSFPEMLDFP